MRRFRNIDLQSVCPAGLEPAEGGTAEKISAGRTGHSPMFRAFGRLTFIRYTALDA